jgi:hypothetical protein
MRKELTMKPTPTPHYLYRPDPDSTDFVLMNAAGEKMCEGTESDCMDYHHDFTNVRLIHGLPPAPAMTVEEAIALLADVTLGEPIKSLEDLSYVRLDVLKGRRDFTEDEYPMSVHESRLQALDVIGKSLS